MASKVALINMKGGVGKSTLATNIAWHFACYDNWLKKVLLIDLDPQFNASQYLLGAYDYRSKIVSPNTLSRPGFGRDSGYWEPTSAAGSLVA
jgi:cellulose biosynthesis protein BcsQ